MRGVKFKGQMARGRGGREEWARGGRGRGGGRGGTTDHRSESWMWGRSQGVGHTVDLVSGHRETGAETRESIVCLWVG